MTSADELKLNSKNFLNERIHRDNIFLSEGQIQYCTPVDYTRYLYKQLLAISLYLLEECS